MSQRIIIGVMGAGEGATANDIAAAERLGELIAREGWIVLTGGRDAGVMAAATRGAKRIAGSITVGVLPTESGDVAQGVDIPIFTGLGNARDAINVLSSRVVITCGTLSPGTTIEAAFAVKLGKPLILLMPNAEAEAFFRSALVARTPEEAIRLARLSGQ